MAIDPPITLEMTLSQANVVLSALAKRPWEEANDLIGVVHRQVNTQMQQLQQQQMQDGNITRLAPAGE